MLITLPADSSSNLDWDVDPHFKGIWHLDFGWKTLDPYDTAGFNSHLFAVEEFAKLVLYLSTARSSGSIYSLDFGNL